MRNNQEYGPLAADLVTAYSGPNSTRPSSMPVITNLQDISLDEALRTLATVGFELMDVSEAEQYVTDIDDPFIGREQDITYIVDTNSDDDRIPNVLHVLDNRHRDGPAGDTEEVGAFVFDIASDLDGVGLGEALRIVAFRSFGPLSPSDQHAYADAAASALICHDNAGTYLLCPSDEGECLDTLEIYVRLTDEQAKLMGDSFIVRQIVFKEAAANV